MPKYRVLINGKNFLIPWIGTAPKRTGIHEVVFHQSDSDSTTKLRWVGFYTNVYVTARSPDEAEDAAIAVIWADDSIHALVHNPPAWMPRLYAEEIEELSSFRGCHRPRQGLGFYLSRRPRKCPSITMT